MCRCQKTPSHCEKAHELPEYQENQDKTRGHQGRSTIRYFFNHFEISQNVCEK